MRFVGVALAGGDSTRMGRDKKQLIRQNQTMLEYTEQLLLSAGASEIVVSSKLGATSGVPDKFSGLGPLAGIEAVLSSQPINSWCLFCPIDLPLLEHSTLSELVEFAKTSNSAAHYQYHPLPLFIQATPNNLIVLSKLITHSRNLSIRHFLSLIDSVSLPITDEQNWLNTNTPAQWQQALAKIN